MSVAHNTPQRKATDLNHVVNFALRQDGFCVGHGFINGVQMAKIIRPLAAFTAAPTPDDSSSVQRRSGVQAAGSRKAS